MSKSYEERMAALGIDRGQLAKGFESGPVTVDKDIEPTVVNTKISRRVREADLPPMELPPAEPVTRRPRPAASGPQPPAKLVTLGFRQDELKALHDKGILQMPGVAIPVEKNGTPLATEGAQRSLWMDITPALAKQWLRNNFRNRSLREETVDAYARDMANGLWVPTHQGLAFNDRDELIDGQHRLHAIVRAGVTIRMMVTFGLPAKIEGSEMTTMDAVDRGATRSVADQLKIQHNLGNASILAAICAQLGGLCFGQRTKRLSVGQTLDIYRAFQHPIDFVIANRSKEHGLKAAGVLAAFAFAMVTEQAKVGSKESAFSQWYLQLVSGKAIDAMSALARLRDFLVSDDAKLLNRGMDRGVSELVLEALRLQPVAGQVYQLASSPAGLSHFKALQPERVEKIAAIFRLP
jgi:hypothetical protein